MVVHPSSEEKLTELTQHISNAQEKFLAGLLPTRAYVSATELQGASLLERINLVKLSENDEGFVSAKLTDEGRERIKLIIHFRRR